MQSVKCLRTVQRASLHAYAWRLLLCASRQNDLSRRTEYKWYVYLCWPSDPIRWREHTPSSIAIYTRTPAYPAGWLCKMQWAAVFRVVADRKRWRSICPPVGTHACAQSGDAVESARTQTTSFHLAASHILYILYAFTIRPTLVTVCVCCSNSGIYIYIMYTSDTRTSGVGRPEWATFDGDVGDMSLEFIRWMSQHVRWLLLVTATRSEVIRLNGLPSIDRQQSFQRSTTARHFGEGDRHVDYHRHARSWCAIYSSKCVGKRIELLLTLVAFLLWPTFIHGPKRLRRCRTVNVRRQMGWG